MGKLTIVLMAFIAVVSAEETASLQQNCLNCHREQQIPSSLIYKRYLMKYSTDERMTEVMFAYMKDPKKEHSIMPAPFFLKFPMKEKLGLDDAVLKKSIEAYLEKYDMKKRLILEVS